MQLRKPKLRGPTEGLPQVTQPVSENARAVHRGGLLVWEESSDLAILTHMSEKVASDLPDGLQIETEREKTA